MANDSNELKNNAPCEERQEARQLTEEELAHVTGGETSRRIRTDEPIARDVAVRAGCAIVIKKNWVLPLPLTLTWREPSPTGQA